MSSILQQNHDFQNTINGQDRTYFNIHIPTRLNYDECWPRQNIRNAPLPESEVNRQTGSGRFSTMPVKMKGGALSPAYNNVEPGVGGEEPKTYLYSAGLHSQIINKINGHQLGGSLFDKMIMQNKVLSRSRIPQLPTGPLPSKLQRGGSYAHLRHFEPNPSIANPALNNVFPGTRIPEPMRVYELSEGSKIHSGISDPIIQIPHKPREKYSDDDGKSFKSTNRYYNSFIHVRNNPLLIRG